mmetsp:Transcript_46704/g.120410  ORF Transcript_46704/g.120410 Transcript_46704/m.120410 type:complete len:207 (-) Transcript_46704:545-1165(-)
MMTPNGRLPRRKLDIIFRLCFGLFDLWNVFAILHFLLSVGALASRNFFLYSFHLLEIVLFETKSLWRSLIFIKSKLLILGQTFLLWFIILFWYTIVGFVYFRTEYVEYDEDNHEIMTDQHCKSVVECLFFTLDYGIRIGEGVGEMLAEDSKGWDSPLFFPRFFFDVSYFLIAVVILLAIVSGTHFVHLFFPPLRLIYRTLASANYL